MSENKCAECDKPAELKCSACKLVSYCGKEHQIKNWKNHKGICRPFEVESSTDAGKCLVATRDILPGDLILSEYPLVYGPRPHMVEEGPVPCPGCCRLILAEGAARCEGCDFPVCHPHCEGLRNPEKHAHECMLLSLRDVKAINGLHNFYRQDTLLALRCLVLQYVNAKKYKKVMEMEAHTDKRNANTETYKEVDSRVCDYFHDNFFGPLKIFEGKTGKTFLEDTSRETIQKICGIIDVNALEINQDSEISALYPTAYLMQHSCVSNTVHYFSTVEESFKITVKAAIPIKKGDTITTMYTHALWGTQARREHLRETKYFLCKCERCKDPTELGTFLSAIKCIGTGDEPCGGTQLPLNPLDDNTEWVCDKCEVKITNAEAAYLINKIGEEVDNIQLSDPTVRDLENLLNKMSTFLHPNHYHCYAVEHSLIQLYGYQQGYTSSQITEDTLKRKIQICKKLAEITKKIDPGNSRLPLYNGVILHELYLANMIFIKRQYDIGIKSAMLVLLKECEKALYDAKEALKNEVSTSAGEKLLNLVANSTLEFTKFCQRNKVDLKKEIKEQ